MRKLSILGSTGSIGKQALDVARNYSDDIKISALSAGSNIDLLAKQAKEFKPLLVNIGDESLKKELELALVGTGIRVTAGMEGLIEVATIEEADIVLTAVVGMMGIRPTIAAIEAGKDIALANKETLVTAGHIIMPLAKEKGVAILPVDSEHSAIFQCLQGERLSEVDKVILTASGGPFRGFSKEELENVTLEQALKHPNWSMGKKITIDSASMVNKGLEVIEAKWLFDKEADDIEVVVHPQSIIHSMVEFKDGAIKAQLGSPDMRLPIQYALFYPERRPMNTERLDFFKLAKLDFCKADPAVFKGLKFAYESVRLGGNIPTIFNAVNELAVSKFLAGEIRFIEIYEMIEKALEDIVFIKNPDLNQVLETEKAVYTLFEA